METTRENSPDVLCVEISAEARRASGAIMDHAREMAASLLAAAGAEAEKIRCERRTQTASEAGRRAALILAGAAVEIIRQRAVHTEELLESVRQQVRRGLAARAGDVHPGVVALAAEAAGRMPGAALVVRLSAADLAAYGPNLAAEVKQRTGRSSLNLTVCADATLAGGDVMVEDAEGLQFWDNRLSSRLERLWPELRRQMAVKMSLAGNSHSTGGAP